VDTPVANSHSARAYLYQFQFGAYADTLVYAWGRGVADALEAAAEWLLKESPDSFTDPEYDEAATEIGAPDDWRTVDGPWAERVRTAAEADLTYTEAGFIHSAEWYVSEVTDPTVLRRVRNAG